MYNFKIEEIITNNNDVIIPKKINIIVGPNSAGKSRLLKDIRNKLDSNMHGNKMSTIIVKDMKYTLPKSAEEFIESYNINKRMKPNSRQGNYIIKNYSGFNIDRYTGNYDYNMEISDQGILLYNNWYEELDKNIKNFYKTVTENELLVNELISKGENPENYSIESQTILKNNVTGEKRYVGGTGGPSLIPAGIGIERFINTYGQLFYQYIGTEEKLLSIRNQPKYGVEDNNSNLLSEIFLNREILEECSKKCKKLFGKELALDDNFTHGKVCIRVGTDLSYIKKASRNDSQADIKLLDEEKIDNEGDGLKSFVSTYLSLKQINKNVILLDEPESFLHPPIVKELGKLIVESSSDDKQIFISTHSADLLSSILLNTTDVNIIRIEREKFVNKISILNKDDMDIIINNPMILTSNLMNGLFCKKVFIVEGYSDSIIFQSLLNKVGKLDDYYFISTQGKEEIPKIGEFFDKLKIKTKMIYDFDFIRYLKNDKLFYKALHNKVSKSEYDELKNICIESTKYIDTKKDVKKTSTLYHLNGISNFDNNIELKSRVIEMLDKIEEYGIYVIRSGALESVLKDANLPAVEENKDKWFINALTKINNMKKSEVEQLDIYELLER